MKILFICSGNRDRSPTAEAAYKWRAGLEVRSAGTSPEALIPLTEDLAAWADLFMVMEPAHADYLRAAFPAAAGKPVHCLNIPDRYRSMSRELLGLIEERVEPLLPPSLRLPQRRQ